MPALSNASTAAAEAPRRRAAAPLKCDRSDVKYYFAGDNPQLAMLGQLASEANWAVCTIEALPSLLAFIGALAGANLTLGRANVARKWPGFAGFRARVPWSDVAHHYAEDDALYRGVAAAPHSGCVARLDSQHLRRLWGRARGGGTT